MGEFQGVYDSGGDRPKFAVRDLFSPTLTLEKQACESQFAEDPPDVDITELGEVICNFLLENIRLRSPEWILEKFLQLFFYRTETGDTKVDYACWQLIDRNQKQQFLYTLKRSFYILIHNWNATRNPQAIQQLLTVFSRLVETEKWNEKQSLLPRRLIQWLADFLHSDDYQQIQYFTERDSPENSQTIPQNPKEKHDRYRSSLSISQCIIRSQKSQDPDLARCQQLKEQFKFELAMYTVCAHSPSAIASEPQYKNPTLLGDRIWPLIHKVLEKRGIFSRKNLANIFLKQTEGMRYDNFKQSLLKYLMFSSEEEFSEKLFKKSIERNLFALYKEYDRATVDNSLLLRTCNRTIEFLTSSDRCSPSPLFTRSIARDRGVCLAIILLKIILICQESYSNLEACITVLVRYYESQLGIDCLQPLQFLEALGVTLTLCVEDVCYDLVKMANYPQQKRTALSPSYRVFSQVQH